MQLEKAATILRSIAHPSRIAILELLDRKKTCNVTEIHETLGMEQAITSNPLAVLRKKGILSTERSGKNVFYSLNYEKIGVSFLVVFFSFLRIWHLETSPPPPFLTNALLVPVLSFPLLFTSFAVCSATKKVLKFEICSTKWCWFQDDRGQKLHRPWRSDVRNFPFSPDGMT